MLQGADKKELEIWTNSWGRYDGYNIVKKTENRLRNKIKGKYKYLVALWKLTDPVQMLLQVVNDPSN